MTKKNNKKGIETYNNLPYEKTSYDAPYDYFTLKNPNGTKNKSHAVIVNAIKAYNRQVKGADKRETVGLRTKGQRFIAGVGYVSARNRGMSKEARELSARYHTGTIEPNVFGRGKSYARNVQDPKNNMGYFDVVPSVPVRMREKGTTYSPEKDKERVLKRVYDGMYVYGTQKKKK